MIRRLVDGERFDFAGRHYQLHEAFHAPRSIRGHLPFLIGGSGPKKTLRIVATHADAWDTAGDIDVVTTSDRLLREHCDAIGRDESTIERVLHLPIVVRDSSHAAHAAIVEAMQRTGQDTVYPGSMASPRRWRMVSARTSISAFGRSSRCCRLRSIARPSTGSPRGPRPPRRLVWIGTRERRRQSSGKAVDHAPAGGRKARPVLPRAGPGRRHLRHETRFRAAGGPPPRGARSRRRVDPRPAR